VKITIQNAAAYVVFFSFCWKPRQHSQYSDCPTGWRSRNRGSIPENSKKFMFSYPTVRQWVPTKFLFSGYQGLSPKFTNDWGVKLNTDLCLALELRKGALRLALWPWGWLSP